MNRTGAGQHKIGQTISFPGLGIGDFTVNRVAFTLFGQPIYWYGIIIACAFLLAIGYILKRARTFGVDPDRALDVVIGGVIGGESDSGTGELQDTEMEVGTITNSGAGWNTYHFREAFEGVPNVVCQAEDFDGVVLVKDITAEGFLYCLRTLQLLHRCGDWYQSGA